MKDARHIVHIRLNDKPTEMSEIRGRLALYMSANGYWRYSL